MALGERMLNARVGDIADHRTYFIASDGDLQEGVASEASSLAGHLGLGRLIGFYDDNHISIEGDTALSFSEDVGARYEAYGWHVQNLGEDIGLDALEAAVTAAQEVEDKPSLIIIRTHIAPGSPNKQDTHEAHGAPLGEEEIRLTKQAYDWPSEEPFFIPDEALAAVPAVRRARAGARQRLAGAVRRLPRLERRAGGRVRAHDDARAARGLRRRRAEEGPRVGHDRHPQGLATRSSSGRPSGSRSSSAARPTSRPRHSP